MYSRDACEQNGSDVSRAPVGACATVVDCDDGGVLAATGARDDRGVLAATGARTDGIIVSSMACFSRSISALCVRHFSRYTSNIRSRLSRTAAMRWSFVVCCSVWRTPPAGRGDVRRWGFARGRPAVLINREYAPARLGSGCRTRCDVVADPIGISDPVPPGVLGTPTQRSPPDSKSIAILETYQSVSTRRGAQRRPIDRGQEREDEAA